MKTGLSVCIAGGLAFAFLGCAGGDDGPGLAVPVDASRTTDNPSDDETIPAPVEANPPVSHLPEDLATDPPPLDDSGPADVDSGDVPEPLDWRPCGQFENRALECAELEVPVDYEQPDADTVSIALRRILASPLEAYRGALLFNPGGPGIDGAVGLFENGLFNRIAAGFDIIGFDIIGFDPCGVDESAERGCGIAPAGLSASATAPEGEGDLQDTVDDFREQSEKCEEQWEPLFRKIRSNNVVRDMDEIRKALGEAELNFLGGSYGARLGALYAHDYPETTGRIVLEAPVHPRASFIEMRRGQFDEIVDSGSMPAAGATCP